MNSEISSNDICKLNFGTVYFITYKNRHSTIRLALRPLQITANKIHWLTRCPDITVIPNILAV